MPRRAADVLAEQLDDELILYEPRAAQGYVLNATAAHIWQHCDGLRDAASIAATLVDAYPVSAEQALADTEACLELLLQWKLLEDFRSQLIA